MFAGFSTKQRQVCSQDDLGQASMELQSLNHSAQVIIEAFQVHIFVFNTFFLLSEILAAKKKTYSDLAKVDIDNTRQKLDSLRIEREAEGEGYLLLIKNFPKMWTILLPTLACTQT